MFKYNKFKTNKKHSYEKNDFRSDRNRNNDNDSMY